MSTANETACTDIGPALLSTSYTTFRHFPVALRNNVLREITHGVRAQNK
jgi:hypothetical protein